MSNLQSLFIREEIIKSIRNFFYNQSFHEVIIPTLNESIPLEPNIYPFSTKWETKQGTKELFLSTSPEKGLKKMLAYGIGNCFAISKSFRNLENKGSQHIPEFLMLEWYRENSEHKQIMKDVQELILYVKNKIDNYEKRKLSPILEYQNLLIDLSKPWKIYSLLDLFFEFAHLDYEEIVTNDSKLFEAANKKGYKIQNTSWNELFDQIFVNEIEVNLPKDNPFFITDFPSRTSPLCKQKKEKPYLAERFEFYIAGMEMGNGNTENTDTYSIKKVFKNEIEKRTKLKQTASPIDQSFLESLNTLNNKVYAGIGVGIDRLTMLFANIKSLKNLGI